MKLVVIGSNEFRDYSLVETILTDEISRLGNVEAIITREPYGADFLIKKYAEQNKIAHITKEAFWGIYGPSAGFIRNEELIYEGDRFLFFWDMKCKHVSDILRKASKQRKPIKIVDVSYPNLS